MSELPEFRNGAYFDRAGADAETWKIYNEIFGGVLDYCLIPTKYHNCRLETGQVNLDGLPEAQRIQQRDVGIIINPQYPHLEAIEFFKYLLEGYACDIKDPLRPTLGVYLYGPPGTGKTHIMAAYALELKKLLDGQMEDLFKFTKKYVGRIRHAEQSEAPEDGPARVWDLRDDEDESTFNSLPESASAQEKIELLKKMIKKFRYSPADIIFIEFEVLVEMMRRPEERRETLDAILRAPIVFIDDLHPRGDQERGVIAQHIIERRYSKGEGGATFITSNLEVGELAGVGVHIDQASEEKSPDQGLMEIVRRIRDRCAGMSYPPIDFTGCMNWREVFEQERGLTVQGIVRDRILEKYGMDPPAPKTTSQ